MANIQRVASTFFNAIDEKEGSPYVFRGDQSPTAEPKTTLAHAEAAAESEQEELDRFIAEIEDAADRESAEGEGEEKEEIGRIRYWNRQEFGGGPGRFNNLRNNYSDDEVRWSRVWKDTYGNKRTACSENEYEDNFAGAAELGRCNAGDSSEAESDDDDSEEVFEFKRSRVETRKHDKIGRSNRAAGFRRTTGGSCRQAMAVEDSEMERMLSDLENVWSSSDEEDGFYTTNKNEKNRMQFFEGDDSYEDNAELEKPNTAYGRPDSIARRCNVGLKRNADAEFSKKITNEADDVFSD